MGGFIPCIQMDAYPYEHSPKRKVIPAPYFQVLQAVVVQGAVVDTLTGCAFAVCFLVFLRISWNPGIETEVTVILYVDGASVAAWRTCPRIGTGINVAAFKRTAVFMRILYGVIAPWRHFMPCGAERMPIFIKCNISRGIFRGFIPAVDIDERIDVPPFQQFIGWHMVMCRVKAYVFR